MALVPGQRLGPHEIISLLGAGGMGEVYLANDTKLNRKVAIKVLPDAYASDPDRLARFHREAQAIAAVNHAAIAAIYDLAEFGGASFLVLELIEGETLAERLRRGPVPVEEALRIAREILEALEAAHERGVCHRDLKPANIKITPEGGVKVLDFGLAKFLQRSTPQPSMSHSPTLSLAGTYPGVILGTAGYMSPEQAKGFEADHRSDIFSFGCILYELLSGRQAFEGDTPSEILASVLKSDVDWNALPPRLNPRLIEVLRRCLEKNPKKRWHAAADLRVEIESLIGRGLTTVEPPPSDVSATPWWKRALVAGGIVIGGAALGGYMAWTLKPASQSPITRFSIPLPADQSLTGLGRQAIAISPDGSQLVYVANNRLYVRPLATLESRPVPGSESSGGLVNPTFSPDGQFIAYRSNADGTLKRLALGGGAAINICPMPRQPYGISWHENAIVFSHSGEGVMRVSPDGGVPERIATVKPDEVVDAAQLLPDGRTVMFSLRTSTETWDQGRIIVQPLGDDAKRTTIITGGSDGRYLPTGHIAYMTNGVMLVVPFDVQRLSVTGAPVPLVEGVRRGANSQQGAAPGGSLYTVSRNGTLVYVPGPVGSASANHTDLGLFEAKGTITALKLVPGPYRAPRVSRDGKWVAFESSDDKSSFVSVYEIGGSAVARRLTFDANSRAPLWSPDGQWVIFASNRDGDFAIYRTLADGTGTAEQLTTPEKGTSHSPQAFTPDGRRLVFSVERDGTIDESRLFLLSLADRKVTPLLNTPARDASLSPDGRWIAYGTRRPDLPSPGGHQVFVEPFPPTGAKFLLPQSGGHPVWTVAGDALLTNTTPVESHITPVITSPSFAFGRSVPFPRQGRTELNPVISRRQIDMMPDGRVIGVMSTADVSTRAAEFVVVLNWFEDVRLRAPRR